MKAIHLVSLISIVAIGAALPASAGGVHFKAGLWKAKMQNGGAAGPAMPDMSKLPPSVQAQMKARGIQMGGNEIVSNFCVTPEQAAKDHPDLPNNKDCRTENVRNSPTTFSADLVCTGKLNARGHTDVTFLSPEHYTVHEVVHTTMNGRTMDSVIDVDSTWVSADCGKYKNKLDMR